MTTQTKPIQIDGTDDESQVVLCPQNEDRFVLSFKDTVIFAQWGLGWQAFVDEMRALIEHTKEWSRENSALILNTFLTRRDGELAVIVVPSAGKFDIELSQRIVSLDIELAEKFQRCSCRVMQVPASVPQDLCNFVDPSNAYHVYREANASLEQVAQASGLRN